MPFKKQQFTDLHILLNSDEYDRAIKTMEQWHPAYIALFQKKYPEHKEILKSSHFADFWHKKREALRIPDDTEFRFQPLKGVDDYDFVQGYQFYLLALKSREVKDKAKYEEYLQESISHSCMYAVRTLIHELIKDPVEDMKKYCDTLGQSLFALEEFAVSHGTPGYLLVAKGFLHLALTATGKEEAARKAVAFRYVLKYLHLARLAESDSTEEINNAYFGAGIALGNPFKISTIDSMILQCRGLANNIVPILVQNFIKNEALHDYENTRKRYEADRSTLSLS